MDEKETPNERAERLLLNSIEIGKKYYTPHVCRY